MTKSVQKINKKQIKVGIMQPYFFPYIGYWQLINAVDKFVILDDVNYIVRGFINRNSILVNEKKHAFILPVEKASQNNFIKDSFFCFPNKENEKLIKTIEQSYKKAPYFKDAFHIIESCLTYENLNVVSFIENSINSVCEFLDIKTDIIISSKIEKNNNLKSQDRIIEINKKMKSDVYINPVGGKELYSKEDFQKEGIKLLFISKKEYRYKQYNLEFVDNLSMIDILMFNSKNEIKQMLEYYSLEER